MSRIGTLTSRELSLLKDIIEKGFENAALGLSAMVEKEIRVVSPSLQIAPISQVPLLVGQPDDITVAMYLRVAGDVTGHIMLIVSVEAGLDLVRMLLGSQEAATPLGELEKSALAEVANVTGSFFISALADATGLVIQSSPPAVIIDMVGAALDVPLAPLALSMEEVLVIDTWFSDDEMEIKSLFLMFPDADSLSSIIDRLERAHA